MPQMNLARVKEEMRKLAEERVTRTVGDAPTLTMSQTARVWNKPPSWVSKMKAAGRVPTIMFGDRERVQRAVAIIGLVEGV
jgi:hypothetical protein